MKLENINRVSEIIVELKNIKENLNCLINCTILTFGAPRGFQINFTTTLNNPVAKSAVNYKNQLITILEKEIKELEAELKTL